MEFVQTSSARLDSLNKSKAAAARQAQNAAELTELGPK
jgi:hypothetical protein